MRQWNSTIKIKKKPCISCGREDFIFSKGRCKQCATIQSVAEAEEKEAVDELGDLIDELDVIFSKYIRLKYSDKDGKCACYTCGKIKKWTEQQCGHYLSRRHMFLRWDERNARPQDEHCNKFKHGNIAIYGQKLEDESPGITDILLEESRIPYKWSRSELIAMIEDYSKRLNLLKQQV